MSGPYSAKKSCLAITLEDAIARVVFDQPAKRNAITLEGWRALAECLPDLARRDARVIVLSGSGGNFSAGADIGEFDTVRRDAETARIYEAANSAAFAAIRASTVPVIAAVGGICFGGGFGIAAAADLRIGASDARFAVPAARLGLAYPQDAMVDIVGSAGAQLARYLTFTGNQIDAQTALAAGFLLEVVGPGALETRSAEIARAIAASAPLSVRASKLSIAAITEPALVEAAKAAGDATFDSADYREGRAAFKERRAPRFSGR